MRVYSDCITVGDLIKASSNRGTLRVKGEAWIETKVTVPTVVSTTSDLTLASNDKQQGLFVLQNVSSVGSLVAKNFDG